MSVGLVQIAIVIFLIVLFFAPKKIGQWGESLGRVVGGKKRSQPGKSEEDPMSQAVKAAKMARKLHKASRGGFPWK